MIPITCKRLAEVDFPIAEVSRHAVREKSIRHGHPSTLHQWWARRPLASSRAVLMALLLPDPSDSDCPPAFRARARKILLAMQSRPSGWDSQVKTDEGLQRVLLEFIANFANWDNAANDEYLTASRALANAAHPDETPLVVDPFAGGGSIPLEALRLGCDAFASDLNPVACLILKVILEEIPRHGHGLADELRRVGAEIKANAVKELAHLYPTDADGATPIAYLWARTVHCESPSCGAEIPLMRSMWLCNKTNRKLPRRWALRRYITRPREGPPQVGFEIFQPQSASEVVDGTVTGSNARVTCPCCGVTMQRERVWSQLAAQRGGADVIFGDDGNRIGGARMTAVVTLIPGERGRHYRLPTNADYMPVHDAQQRAISARTELMSIGTQEAHTVPDEPTPKGGRSRSRSGGSAFNIHNYGMLQWSDLFTSRQTMALLEFRRLIANAKPGVQQTILALLLDKMADGNNSLARWESSSENPVNLFARQAISIVWDFCESTPASKARGVFLSGIDAACKVIEADRSTLTGQIQLTDAINHPLPDSSAEVWFTDPPYYDAVPYADLSDFFIVWLKRVLIGNPMVRDPFDPENPLTPKVQEAVQDETKQVDGVSKSKEWFEESMSKAFAEGRRVLSRDGIGSVVFAHKTTEGWEALLSGMIRGGWTITGSWPIATESPSRLRARESASLATSVHLVCRPRPEGAPVGDWADVLAELPRRVGEWMQRLSTEGIRGADLVFACVGPALEIYSRYSRVEEADGSQVELPQYLEKVWEVVGREALEQILGTTEARARNGDAGALEEDARLSALFLWTMQSTRTGFDAADNEERSGQRSPFILPFDVTRRFAQPLGIHLEDWESRIIKTQKGVVRLLPVSERGVQLFGESGADSIADDIESSADPSRQLSLFPEATPQIRGRARRRGRTASSSSLNTRLNATTLDRVHAAMLLQTAGRTEALRALLRAEQDRGPDFLRLANSLSALYPRGSEEKRVLDAMLLAAR